MLAIDAIMSFKTHVKYKQELRETFNTLFKMVESL